MENVLSILFLSSSKLVVLCYVTCILFYRSVLIIIIIICIATVDPLFTHLFIGGPREEWNWLFCRFLCQISM